MDRSPIELAFEAVKLWLDEGDGSIWATRTPNWKGAGMAWDIDVSHDAFSIRWVRLVLPSDFPVAPCELYVDSRHFLELPHVEADGKVCLGRKSIPNDYHDPIGAVHDALRDLRDELLAPATDPKWIASEFAKESLSYWKHFCSVNADKRDVAVPALTYADIGSGRKWSLGDVCAYGRVASNDRRHTLQLVAAADNDPHAIAVRHGWAVGSANRGTALLIPLPAEQAWIPASWPKTYSELDAMVQRTTSGESSLAMLMQAPARLLRSDSTKARRLKKGQRSSYRETLAVQTPRLVVFTQGSICFGYQIVPPRLNMLKGKTVEPIAVTPISSDWALARGYELEQLHTRQERRVLMLGCGSLASPTAKAIVRGGVGELDIVDTQLMESENVSRHELGLADIGGSKAVKMAARLKKEVPGVEVRGYQAEATQWMTKHCKPGAYDLVIDLTAESSVRTFLSHMRGRLIGDAPIIHAWAEPLCSAGHVVLTQPEVPWPEDDPADDLINATDLSASDTELPVQACSEGFHPYGVADIQLIAAFTAERALMVLDRLDHASTVWSWVRSSAYFDSLDQKVTKRAIVPISDSVSDSASITRGLAEVLKPQ